MNVFMLVYYDICVCVYIMIYVCVCVLRVKCVRM
jgi:hypothetical protein